MGNTHYHCFIPVVQLHLKLTFNRRDEKREVISDATAYRQESSFRYRLRVLCYYQSELVS